MLKINVKIIPAISLILLMSACSIAGSWAFGKLDNYLNDYFFTFANFSDTQKEEIETVTEKSLIHISETTRPERNKYAVFCLNKKKH